MKKSLELKQIVKRINKEVNDKITEQDLIDIINTVSIFHRNKVFSYYTSEDICSEIWLIALKSLQYYEPNRGKGPSTSNSLERWLNRVVKNRLANLYRDRYSSVNNKYRQSRMNIMNSLSLEIIDINKDLSGFSYVHKYEDSLIYQELMDFVESRLSIDLLDTYKDCLAGKEISTYYKSKLKSVMADIMIEWYEFTNVD